MFERRDYQLECGTAIGTAFHNGVWSQLVVLPTGGGKTVIFAHLPHDLSAYLDGRDWLNRRMLIIAHRDKLLTQARDKIRRANPDLSIEIEQGDLRASPMAEVVIASIQTLSSNKCARLRRLGPERFAVTVVDEAHHSSARTYQDVLDVLGLLPPASLHPATKDRTAMALGRAAVADWWQRTQPGRLLLGVTATPSRADALGLEWTYRSVTYSKDLAWMIGRGYLVPPAGFLVESGLNLDTVKTIGGDFQQTGLAAVVNTHERNASLVKAWQDHAAGRCTIGFAVDVQHAKDLAGAFLQHGVRAAFVHGDDPLRDAKIEDFERGVYDVLINCELLTEGYDHPAVSCILMARPTKSQSLYSQMIGRGLRLFDGKSDCVVLDGVDNSSRHQLVTLGDLFGLPRRFNLQGATATLAAAQLDLMRQKHPDADLHEAISLDDLAHRVRSIDLFSAKPSKLVAEYASLKWIQDTDRRFHLAMPDRAANGAITNRHSTRVEIAQGTLGDWEVVIRSDNVPQDLRLGYASDIRGAFELGEKWIANNRPEQRTLHDPDAAWRRRPPTEKQIMKLQQWGAQRLPTTRGEAAEMMDAYIRNRRW